MAESTTTRLIKAPRSRIYNALVDGQALSKWLHPAGTSSKLHECVPKVGGQTTSLGKSQLYFGCLGPAKFVLNRSPATNVEGPRFLSRLETLTVERRKHTHRRHAPQGL